MFLLVAMDTLQNFHEAPSIDLFCSTVKSWNSVMLAIASWISCFSFAPIFSATKIEFLLEKCKHF